MSSEQVEVEVTVPASTEAESDNGTDAVATDHVIDAAIESGISAERAAEDADNASTSELISGINADQASEAADVAIDAADRAEQVLAALTTVTQQNAEMIAMMQAAQSQQTAAAVLPDAIADAVNPDLDIEPESSHWLSRRWGAGLFGKKGE